MVGRLLTVLIVLAISCVSGAAAQQAPVDTLAVPAPTEAPPDTMPAEMAEPDTAMARVAPAGPAEVMVYGLVTDANGLPMAGVSVNLFLAGLEEQSAVTDTSGAFSLTQRLDMAADETVVMWFTPPRGMGFVRELVVLKESKASAAGGHYGPCVTKAFLTPSTFLEVQILDQASYAKKIEELGCMDMAAGMGDATYELRYDLPGGQTLTMTSSTSERSLSGGGAAEATTTEAMVEYTVTVQTAGTEGLALELEYKNRELTSDAPGSAGDVDFSTLIGQKASLFISPVGELSRFAGFDALPEIAMGPVVSLNSERYINELRTLLPVLPAEPVGRGDSWSKEYRFQQGLPGGTGNVTINVTYTLTGQTMVRGINCLEIDSEFTTSFSGQGEMRGAPYTMTMDGSGTEKIYFAHERGMMLEKSGQSKMTGGTESQGMTFPMDQESSSTVQIVFQ